MNPQPQLNIDPSKLEDVKCATCGGQYWNPIFMVKRVPALMSPTGQTAIAPMDFGYVCDKCGDHIEKTINLLNSDKTPETNIIT